MKSNLNLGRLMSCLLVGGCLVNGAAYAADAVAAPRAALAPGSDPAGDADFWRSAERIGTADAYRAYLEAYPNGRFGPLARAALAKAAAGPNTGTSAPIPAKATAPNAGATLKPFSEPAPHSDAITFKLGDRFTGPGIVTVGWLGAKKQVVLPAGEWTTMAARDHDGSLNKFTTVVFGKFTGDQLTTQLLVTLTRVPSANRAVNWPDVAGCEQPDPLAHYQWHADANGYQRECLKVKAFGGPVLPGLTEDEFRASLERIGGRRAGAMVISNLYFADQSNGFMRIARVDFPALQFGEQGQRQRDWQPEATTASTARDAYIKALTRWMDVYRKYAADGFRRELSQADLLPGASAPGLSAVMGVGEFEPAKPAALASK